MTRNDTAINTSNGINLVAGIWLIIAPFILSYATFGVSSTNDVILGVVIGILAIIQMTNHRMNWPSWVNGLLGLWSIISPFVLGYTNVDRVLWNDIVLGVVVGVSAILSGMNAQIPTEMHR